MSAEGQIWDKKSCAIQGAVKCIVHKKMKDFFWGGGLRLAMSEKKNDKFIFLRQAGTVQELPFLEILPRE